MDAKLGYCKTLGHWNLHEKGTTCKGWQTIPHTEVHDCWENAVPYVSNGALGHGWECGICGNFLQAG